MRSLILIKKIFEQNDIYYYEVYKNDSLDEISFYIGLDFINKKILFFANKNFQIPVCVYNVVLKKFDLRDLQIFPLIDLRVIMRSSNAILENNFVEDISWEG